MFPSYCLGSANPPLSSLHDQPDLPDTFLVTILGWPAHTQAGFPVQNESVRGNLISSQSSLLGCLLLCLCVTATSESWALSSPVWHRDIFRSDHVLPRLLARAEHLHQEEVEEQQTEAGPAGPGGGSACPHSEVRKIYRIDRFLYWVTSGSSRELRRGGRRRMIWRRKDKRGRRQTRCRSSGRILKFF